MCSFHFLKGGYYVVGAEIERGESGGQLALDLALMDDVPPIGVDSREILRNVARVCELYLEAKEGG